MLWCPARTQTNIALINYSMNIADKKCTSFAIEGQQHSSGIPNVPVISSGCEGGSDVTTAELEL